MPPSWEHLDAPSGARVTAVLADHVEGVDDRLRAALALAGVEVRAESDGAQSATVVRALRPDVVLLLADDNAIGLISQLSSVAPSCRVVFVDAGQRTPIRALDVMAVGATGYLTLDETPAVIALAVVGAAAGACVLSGPIAARVFDRVHRDEGTPARAEPEGGSPLTDREVNILRQLATGSSNKEIGFALSLSQHTVASHVAAILDKLGVENRVQAAVHAVRTGLG